MRKSLYLVQETPLIPILKRWGKGLVKVLVPKSCVVSLGPYQRSKLSSQIITASTVIHLGFVQNFSNRSLDPSPLPVVLFTSPNSEVHIHTTHL